MRDSDLPPAPDLIVIPTTRRGFLGRAALRGMAIPGHGQKGAIGILTVD